MAINIIVDSRRGASSTDALRVAIPLLALTNEGLAADAVLETSGGVEFYPQSSDGVSQVYTSLAGAWANGRNTVALSESGSPSNPRFIPGAGLGSQPCGGSLALSPDILPVLTIRDAANPDFIVGEERRLQDLVTVEAGAAGITTRYARFNDGLLMDAYYQLYRDSNFIDFAINITFNRKGGTWFLPADELEIAFGQGCLVTGWYESAFSTLTVNENAATMTVDMTGEYIDPDLDARASARVPLARGLETARTIQLRGRLWRPVIGAPTAAETTLWAQSKTGTLRAIADAAAWEGSFGFFGHVPLEPASKTLVAAAGTAGVFSASVPLTTCITKSGRGLNGNEYSMGLGLNPGGSDPGWSPDFSTEWGSPLFWSTWGLDELLLGAWDVGTLRQYHWLDSDGTPLTFQNHPLISTWESTIGWYRSSGFGSDSFGMTTNSTNGQPINQPGLTSGSHRNRAGDGGRMPSGNQHKASAQATAYYRLSRDLSFFPCMTALAALDLGDHRQRRHNVNSSWRTRDLGRWATRLSQCVHAIPSLSPEFSTVCEEAWQQFIGNGGHSGAWYIGQASSGNPPNGTCYTYHIAKSSLSGAPNVPQDNPMFTAMMAQGLYLMWVQTGNQAMFDECQRACGTQFEHQYVTLSDGEIALPYKIRIRGASFPDPNRNDVAYTAEWGLGYSPAQRTQGSADYAFITEGPPGSRWPDLWGVFAAQFLAYYGASAEHPNAQRIALQFLNKYSGGSPLSHAHAHFACTFDALIPTQGHRGL